MNHAALLVQVSDTLGDLENDMPCEIFAEVSKFDDLMEQFPSLHDCKCL